MFTSAELIKKLNEQLTELVNKEKSLFKDSLNAATIEEALDLVSKAEEVYAEIQKIDKRLLYLKRVESLSQSYPQKSIGLT